MHACLLEAVLRWLVVIGGIMAAAMFDLLIRGMTRYCAGHINLLEVCTLIGASIALALLVVSILQAAARAEDGIGRWRIGPSQS